MIERIVEVLPDGDVVVHVHVQPRAGRTEIAGRHGDALKVRVQEPPLDGRATEAARRAVAAALELPEASVRVMSGERSRYKRFRLVDVDAAAVTGRLRVLLGVAG